MLPSWANDVRMQDVERARSGIVGDIVAAIGIEATLQLLDAIGGATVYLPKPEAVLNAARDRRIRDEYNGYNARALAVRYHLTDIAVGRIARRAPAPGASGQALSP